MLTSRENQILRAVVHEYLASAQPVGSQHLWSRYGLGISPATIRHVMAALTESGYLEQPHTSAGRVPTERAYRLFLEGAERSAPSLAEREKVSRRIAKAASSSQAGCIIAEQLAELAGAAAVYADNNGSRVYRLANVFGLQEFQDPHVAHYVAELLDRAAEWLPKLAEEPGKFAIRIGHENHDWRARQVSVMAVRLPGSQPAYLAVVGPTRLPYRKLTAVGDFAIEEMKKHHG